MYVYVWKCFSVAHSVVDTTKEIILIQRILIYKYNAFIKKESSNRSTAENSSSILIRYYKDKIKS